MRYLKKIRLVKENFEEEVKVNLAHLTDDNFQISVNKVFDESSYLLRIWKSRNVSEDYSYENSEDFEWDVIEDELARLVTISQGQYDIDYLYTIASKEQDGLGFKRTEWDVYNLIEKGTFGYANPGKIKCVLLKLREV